MPSAGRLLLIIHVCWGKGGSDSVCINAKTPNDPNITNSNNVSTTHPPGRRVLRRRQLLGGRLRRLELLQHLLYGRVWLGCGRDELVQRSNHHKDKRTRASYPLGPSPPAQSRRWAAASSGMGGGNGRAASCFKVSFEFMSRCTTPQRLGCRPPFSDWTPAIDRLDDRSTRRSIDRLTRRRKPSGAHSQNETISHPSTYAELRGRAQVCRQRVRPHLELRVRQRRVVRHMLPQEAGQPDGGWVDGA